MNPAQEHAGYLVFAALVVAVLAIVRLAKQSRRPVPSQPFDSEASSLTAPLIATDDIPRCAVPSCEREATRGTPRIIRTDELFGIALVNRWRVRAPDTDAEPTLCEPHGTHADTLADEQVATLGAASRSAIAAQAKILAAWSESGLLKALGNGGRS